MKYKRKLPFATVKGDIDDIGKNLVALILKNYSYRVRDFGVDVPSSRIVDTAIEWGSDVIALSSLMTITMEKMGDVAGLLKSRDKDFPLLIGGAAVTEKYVWSIRASYAKDVIAAVDAVSEIFKA